MVSRSRSSQSVHPKLLPRQGVHELGSSERSRVDALRAPPLDEFVEDESGLSSDVANSRARSALTNTSGLEGRGIDSPAPLLPEAGRLYSTNVEWQGRRKTVTVKIDQVFVEYMQREKLQLDLSQLALVGHPAPKPLISAEGWKAPLSSLNSLLTGTELGDEPILISAIEIWGSHFNEVGDFTSNARVNHFESEINFFDYGSHSHTHSVGDIQQSMVPLDPNTELLTVPVAPGVVLRGVDHGSMASVEAAVSDVLGLVLKDREHRLAESNLQRSRLDALPSLSSVIDTPREAEFIRAVQAILGPDSTTVWSIDEAVVALTHERGRLLGQLADIEIVVVPADKHFSVMPQWRAHSQGEVPPMTMGVSYYEYVDSGIRYFILIPENDPVSQRHELYHLLEGVFLGAYEKKIIANARDVAVANQGPFARPYGAVRGEYFTTMAELFEGAHGVAGIQWLKSNAPDIYDILSRATGRNP